MSLTLFHCNEGDEQFSESKNMTGLDQNAELPSFFILVSENAHLIFINLNLWRQFKMKLNMFYRCIKIIGIFKPLNFNQCKFCWYTWRCTNFWFSIWFKKNIHQCTLLKCEQVVMTVNGQCPLIPPKPLSLSTLDTSLLSLLWPSWRLNTMHWIQKSIWN